jgi:hypothetical protein
MKKFMVLVLGLIFSQHAAYAQFNVQTWTEDFDGTISFTANPSGSWVSDPTHYLPGSSSINPQSYWGVVPNTLGSTTILQTPLYDFTSMIFITLKFSQICKISPKDTVSIQYQEAGTSGWKNLPTYAYKGKAANYTTQGFNAASYPEWLVYDSTAIPTQGWWKEELFDLSEDFQSGRFTFRFVIKRGQTQGTQVSYGWLLENFEVVAATYSILPPVVEFVAPLCKDTAYSTGPFEINAKVKTSTKARIETPWLIYTATYNSVSTIDSILMTNVQGDSLWKATIPKFVAGTTISYSITGKDTLGNHTTALSGYVIVFPINRGKGDEIYVGNGTTTNYWTPLCTSTPYNWGWTRLLYQAAELSPTSQGGWITQLAWQANAAAPVQSVSNQTCYFQATDDMAITRGYIDPYTTPGVTQVWTGTINIAPGYCEIILDNPFYLPPGKNLMIHWYYLHGVAVSLTYFLHHTTTNVRISDAPVTTSTLGTLPSTGSENLNLTNARFTFAADTGSNSVKLSSIDMPETIGVIPGAQVPVVMTLKNLGRLNLTAVKVYYSVNGGAPQLYNWTGNLPWDFEHQATIGSYIPKVNGRDTIVVWLDDPNGMPDQNRMTDDTLRKIIYGSSDITMAFVTYPADTVTNTGPFDISVRISTLSGTAIGPVSLKVVTTYGGSPTTVYLPMTFNSTTNLWTATIPHTLIESDVEYSITLTDILTNVIIIENRFYIKRTAGVVPNSVALVAVNTPLQGGNTAATAIPIHVIIRNKGTQNLDSCIVSWTLGGVPQTAISYYGHLPEDFTDTITVDYYTPVLGQRDTLVVKVSMPNNVIDPNLSDDSLRIITLGCSGVLQGNVTVGVGETFTTIANALASIRECSLIGDLTLQLKGTFAENVDLTNLTPYLRGYYLTLTSFYNHADSAIIRPASGVGITMGTNSRNIILKNITVNTEHLTTSAVLFSATCTNIVIRDCKLLANLTSTATTFAPIWKASGTGLVDSIFVINNLLSGGYASFYFYGGTGTTAYGKNIVFDSNTLFEAYAYGMRVYYTDFLHISYNTARSRLTTTARWDGFSLQYVNGDIIGNRLIQLNPLIAMDGYNLQYYNYYLSTKRALFANNELLYIVNNARAAGVYNNYTNIDYYHNSFYMSSPQPAGEINALYLESPANSNISLKNNNIVTEAPAGNLLQYSATTNMNQYDMDYNNFYAVMQNQRIGVLSTTPIMTLTDLQQYFPSAQHMISVLPDYVNVLNSTELLVSNGNLYCPLLPAITQDIDRKPRTGTGTMGAYQIVPYTLDMSINKLVSWNSEVVKDQPVSVDIEVQNLGLNNITAAVFGWSLNGQTQTPVSWSPTTPMPFVGKDNVHLGSFTVTTTDTYTITVWLQSVNNAVDMHHSDDTLDAVATRMLLAEWVAPLVGDTIYQVTFDVYARIRTATGAPVSSPPKLKIATIINDTILYDSITMTLSSGIWKASVPQQYYGSKVIYSLTVVDNMGNSSTITDSVYCKFIGFGLINPALVIGTGTGTAAYNLYYSSQAYSATRHVYMDWEISPQRTGGFIRSIAFYNTTATASICDNVSFYLKATTDSVITATYLDPITDGATLVWGSATSTAITGWNVFTLHVPFYLPPGKNLLVYCNDMDNSTANNGTLSYWRYTATTGKSCYGYGTAWPPTYMYTTTYRPNIQLDIYSSLPYKGNNLAITELLKPITDPNDLCSPDYSPVQVVLSNMGANDYNFAINAVTVSMEIINPSGVKDSVSVVFNNGTLKSTASDTIELMASLPIMYSGVYNIKTWVTSPIDNIIYDNTLVYEYISGRIGLPIDIDFSNASVPLQLVATSMVGGSSWTPYTPIVTDTVQPNPGNGTGVLRFEGTAGAMTLLSTRQLDLSSANQPQLEFWYYHDSTLAFTDASYLDVNAILGGVSINLAHLLHRSDTVHGWEYYNISLNQFIGIAQCLLIQFEAMNKYAGNQYIDRIRITALQDMAVREIIIP